LCQDPKENHWELRDFSSQIISFICQKFSNSYHTLQSRITKTLLHSFLDPSKPRSTHYGAIVGITQLGPQVIKVLLLEPSKNSNLKAFYQFLEPELSSTDSLKRHEAIMCFNALKKAVRIFFSSLSSSEFTQSSTSVNEEIESSTEYLTKILKERSMSDISERYLELNEIFGEIFNLVPESLAWKQETKMINEIFL
jgi:transcription initiation factor TFIID subunit 6